MSFEYRPRCMNSRMSSFALPPRDNPFLPAPSALPTASSAAAGSLSALTAANLAATPRSVRPKDAAANPSVSHCSCSDSAYSSLYGPGQSAIQHRQAVQRRRRSSRPAADQGSGDLLLLPQCRTTSSFRAGYDLSPAASDAVESSGTAARASAAAAAAAAAAAGAGSVDSVGATGPTDKSSSSRTSEESRVERRDQLLLDSDNENEDDDEQFNSRSLACTPTLVIQNQTRGSPYAFTGTAPSRSRHHCMCHANHLQLLPPPPPPLETVQPELMFELMQQQQGASILENCIDEDDNAGNWPLHQQLQMHSLQLQHRGQSFQRGLQPVQHCWQRESVSQGQLNHLGGQGATMTNELAAATASTARLERRRHDNDTCVRLQHRRRRPGGSNDGSGRRKGCCCPLLVMSLCLCAVSVALLTVGGVFLGLHLRSQAHSAFLAAAPTDSEAAATPALVEAAEPPSLAPSAKPATATSTAPPTPTPDPAEIELAAILRQLDSRLVGLVDNATHPCEDFYSHACGNFERYADRTLRWPLLTTNRRLAPRPTDIVGLTSALTAQTLRRILEGDFDGLGAVQAEQLLSTEGQQLASAFRRCRLRMEVGADNSGDLCVAALQEAAPESVKSLLRYRSFNATGVHAILVKMFNSACNELVRRVQTAQNISTHTRQSMTRRLDRIHPMIDSSGNADLSVLRHEFKSNEHLNRRLEQLYLLMSDRAETPCLPEPCRAPRQSFSACVCLTNSSDLWLPFSAINPPLFHLAYPEELMYSYLGSSVAEVLYWSISPKHRTELFSSTSEHLLAKSFECFAKQLPGDKPNTVLIEALVAKHVSLSMSLVLFRRSLGVSNFARGGHEVDKRLRLFFLNWAQTQCSTDARQSADSRLLLNAALQRQADFGMVFHCPVSSRHHWTQAPVPCHYP